MKQFVSVLLTLLIVGCTHAPSGYSFLKGSEHVTTNSSLSDGKQRESSLYNLQGALSSVDEKISLELSPQSGWGRREVGDLVEFEKNLIRVVLTTGKVDPTSMKPIRGSEKDWTTVSITTFH